MAFELLQLGLESGFKGTLGVLLGFKVIEKFHALPLRDVQSAPEFNSNYQQNLGITRPLEVSISRKLDFPPI